MRGIKALDCNDSLDKDKAETAHRDCYTAATEQGKIEWSQSHQGAGTAYVPVTVHAIWHQQQAWYSQKVNQVFSPSSDNW